MEQRKTNLIKHTKYIYEYQNAIDDNTVETIDFVLGKEVANLKPDVAYMDYTRNNNGWTLSMFQEKNKNIFDINQALENIGYKFLTQYYRDCPLVREYHKPHGTIGSFMTYRVYNEKDQYNWHTDASHEYKFLVALIIYLNDDFDGGDLLFLNDKIKVSPEKGSILMFPCGPYFVHKSTPIRSGRKSIIWDCYIDVPKALGEILLEGRDK